MSSLWASAAARGRAQNAANPSKRLGVTQRGTIFEADNDNRLYFVVEGECRLSLIEEECQSEDEFSEKGFENGSTKPAKDMHFYNAGTISRLGPGNFFGEGCLFPELKRDRLVEAVSEVIP